jgi:hypothetical protein
MSWPIIVSLVLLNVTHAFQIHNFLTYRDVKNGANETRIVFFLALLCMQIHIWRVHFDMAQGYFFLAGLVFMLYLFIKGYMFK